MHSNVAFTWKRGESGSLDSRLQESGHCKLRQNIKNFWCGNGWDLQVGICYNELSVMKQNQPKCLVSFQVWNHHVCVTLVSSLRLVFIPVNPNYVLTGSKNRIDCWDVRTSQKSLRTFQYKDTFGQVTSVLVWNSGLTLKSDFDKQIFCVTLCVSGGRHCSDAKRFVILHLQR